MHDTSTVTSLHILPPDATFGEAMEWVTRMRRLVDRWNTLPESAQSPMTPDVKRELHTELDFMEETIRRDMAMATA